MRHLAAPALLMVASALPAEAQDISRSCFPGFCVEAVQDFTVQNRVASRGFYALKISRTQSTVYVSPTTAPAFPRCEATCEVRDETGEPRAYHKWTGKLMERLVGPVEPCVSGAPFFVHLFVYDPEASPGWLRIERECP
ncbi:MAG: hypothetical protein CFE31_08125 [Rhizobiales bacterium PAR1]|nr:MAG: hypothetical protein CFE31_08125 [Rhizobiales bacterium PAR1]